MGIIFSLACFLILISVLVMIHELGHLIVARANGVFCEIFSIGFGPKLFEISDKKGTKWRFSLLPLGGYVKMFGDADASSVKEKLPQGYTEADMDKMSAHRKKPWQKLLIAFGGPAANLIFAIFLIFSLAVIKGLPTPDASINVKENTLAYEAGLRTGDIILKANTVEIKDFNQIKDEIQKSVGKELNFSILRKSNQTSVTQDIVIKMYKINEKGEMVSEPILGVAPSNFIYKTTGIFEGLKIATKMTFTIGYENVSAIVKILTAKMETKNVGGIISIFKMTSQSAQAGFASFVWMMALLSIVLGAINLLPIPILDGGTIVISAVEWLIGKPLNKKFIDAIFTVGLIFVVALMLLGIWNDISKCKLFVMLENLFK